MLRHNLEVIHIEKNVCDNITGTLLDIEGKSKDMINAFKDLKDLNIHRELWLKECGPDKFEKSYTSYTLTKEESKGR